MKCLEIKPSKLAGEVNIPPSKSMAHRAIICAFLADGKSEIDNVELSEDIMSTCHAVMSLGGRIDFLESSVPNRKKLVVYGNGTVTVKNGKINCGESGTTARFIMPVSRLTEDTVTIDGKGKLVSRPFSVFFPLFDASDISFEVTDGKLPMTLKGKLKPGNYSVRGDVSSQFISGMLLALPLLSGDSTIQITTKLESEAYIDMTVYMQKLFGVEVYFDKEENKLIIPGKQKYMPRNYYVEGDWSQAAFWLAAGVMSGPVSVSGLNRNSLQGDKVIENIIKSMGGKVYWENNRLVAEKSNLKGISVDISQCPDLAPILAVLGSVGEGKTEILNGSRLRLKESDRIKAIVTEMGKLGADISEEGDNIIINGKKILSGGNASSWNDHRIVMSVAIAAVLCKNNVIIEGFSAVNKSYPSFWEHYKILGGNIVEQYLG
ncbi:3-phosphoshikimate 1-carboxyvinyltransferase AroA [Thermoclostridium stercorarium subsp. stercorarium DSM 8532]|uniref:3-phosphoshikimate 1-carboxyvinyltransferase n=2 Tax=Thermoclostridium stercorarium TaxID=1510 RepID=L7VNN5_THES1|nr:3-phosphoshikimate 1-carboxyvinyltransferase [Thermoclostridium stercorarium]AGC68284.1 3-phosphoshikimate 1-carboxyvinyltransferase AroA [Thermoclostridium stercorarium subsp. stercorarium DSM 8532]AGI39313.1 3-phosphoshikimate 1-carboxyvinyltransferase [Thermoclostridium stercorarium subsp. stercorarium DSM 8532]ANW98641.1 3-phosphoshikimate 1-carboxyvinyltransferase [Thermoclostridium stercorarium subsp. thermolacticum DSM 2910]